MAKELPYFKFEPSEWLEGEIQILSDTAIACFINICSGYWLKLGCISYAFALHKYCRKDASILQELIDAKIITIKDENIVIKFLDIQLKDFNCLSKKRKEAAQKRWSNANALQKESKSNAIREEKIREDKIKEYNIPSFSDFLSFAKEKEPDICEKDLKRKYESWVTNGWKDGNNKKILSWKSKLLNTLKYIDKISTNNKINLNDEKYKGF